MSLLAAGAVLIAIIVSTTGGSSGSGRAPTSSNAAGSTTAKSSKSSSAASASNGQTIPILTYYVINSRPPQSSAPADLYVPAAEFASQLSALKAGGWHAVTLNQVLASWTSGKSLGPGKPIVISFDNGYASQYTNGLPVLKALGWPAVANLEVNGLSPLDGGLNDAQIRGLIAAGWEIDSEGIDHTDLTAVGPAQLQQEIAGSRQALRSRYGVPVNWFCYPFGRYDQSVVAAVRTAGFSGATTTATGWASPQGDRFRLPRLQVAAGTTPDQLLSQIAAAKQQPPPPATYTGAGIA